MNVISPFSGNIVTFAAVLAVPILLAAGYWLLVVNGPTPVVKARIDDPGNRGFPGKQSVLIKWRPFNVINFTTIHPKSNVVGVVNNFLLSKIVWSKVIALSAAHCLTTLQMSK